MISRRNSLRLPDEILNPGCHHAASGHAVADGVDLGFLKIDEGCDDILYTPADKNAFRSEPARSFTELEPDIHLFLLLSVRQVDEFIGMHLRFPQLR
jgi:hypothetical protein